MLIINISEKDNSNLEEDKLIYQEYKFFNNIDEIFIQNIYDISPWKNIKTNLIDLLVEKSTIRKNQLMFSK